MWHNILNTFSCPAPTLAPSSLPFIQFVRFKFKSGNLEHPGDIIRNASVEVLPVKALAQAKKMSG